MPTNIDNVQDYTGNIALRSNASTFPQDAEDQYTYLAELSQDLNVTVNQMNAAISETNDNAISAEESKDAAALSASSAETSAQEAEAVALDNQAQLDAFENTFQNRFAFSQPTLPWTPLTVIADELQLYSTGTIGESGYSVWLADPALLPFTTSAIFAEDEALGRWQIATVATQDYTTLEALARSLNTAISNIIFSNDVSTNLSTIKYIYNIDNQTVYESPYQVTTEAYLVSMSGNSVVTTAGTYAVPTPQRNGIVDIADWGAVMDGDSAIPTDDTDAVVNATEYAYLHGIRFVTVSGPTYVTGDVDRKSNVIYVGDGRFTKFVNSTRVNIGIYRRQVIPLSALDASAYVDNIQSVGVKDPTKATVVFFGDSLSTFTANATSANNTKSAHFQRMIESSNRNTEFTYYNRAIGGQSASVMNSKPASLGAGYEWYTDINIDWLEYIYALDPDIVVMATGMNEDSTFDPQDIIDITAKIAANTDASIVYVADYTPVLSPVGKNVGSSFAWNAAQEWRDRAAGYIRSYANYIKAPLIDLNRTFGMVRDGRDILALVYKASDDYTLTDGSLVGNNSRMCRGFSVRLTLPVESYTNPDPIAITLDAAGTSVWIQDIGGELRLRFNRGGSDGGTPTFLTGLPTPTTDNDWEITVDGTTFSIRDLTTGARYNRFSVECIKIGGLYQPRIDYFAQSTGPVANVIGWYPGVEVSVMPTVTDQEFFGTVLDGEAEDLIIGGDGKVHPSTLGLEALHGNHYSRQNLVIVNRDNNFLVATATQDGIVSDIVLEYTQNADGTYSVNGSTLTDSVGNVLITLPFESSKGLRELATLSPWVTTGQAAFIAMARSTGSSQYALAIETVDTSGSPIGARNVTFTISGKRA